MISSLEEKNREETRDRESDTWIVPCVGGAAAEWRKWKKQFRFVWIILY
jgi:hypothetical protein